MEVLKETIRTEMHKFFSTVLDMACVAMPKVQYENFRARTLRAGNDCMRIVEAFIDNNYTSDEELLKAQELLKENLSEDS